jgi:hypothetical protein
MNVVYSDSLVKVSRLRVLAEQATKRLEEIVGRSTDIITADWDKAHDDEDHPLLGLKLSNPYGFVTAQFIPDEMQNAGDVRNRLTWLLGDLLQHRSHRLLQSLLNSQNGQEEGF